MRRQLEERMKKDHEIREFMKGVGMFAPGVYEMPEIREVTQGHLVRSGQTSVSDVNFGKGAGAAAVIMLREGLSGNTIVKVKEKEIFYRTVDMDEITLYEALGVCLGRKPLENISLRFIWR